MACLRTWSREGWELEGPGVAFSLEQSEEAFGLWSERRAGDVTGRAEVLLAEIHGLRSTKKSYRPSQGGDNVEDQAPRAVPGYSHNALLLLCLYPARATHPMGPAPLGNNPPARADGGTGTTGRRLGPWQARLLITLFGFACI